MGRSDAVTIQERTQQPPDNASRDEDAAHSGEGQGSVVEEFMVAKAHARPDKGRPVGNAPPDDSTVAAEGTTSVPIQNPGFEEGFVPAPHGMIGFGWEEWTFSQGGLISYEPSTAPSPVHSGSYAQLILAENSDVALYQQVTSGLTPGQEYMLSVWLFMEWPVECLLGYEPYGGPPAAIVNWVPALSEPGVWTRAEMLLFAESSVATIALRIMSFAPFPVVNDDWSLQVYVPPVCSFTMSPAATEQEVVFDSTSTDPDGTIVAWDWSFGDGHAGSGDPATHAYASSGTYTVTLTVTDDDGFTASCSDVISVVGTVVSRAFPYGWSMMSLPLEPVVPDPEVVFAGIPISGNLHRYDHVKAGLIFLTSPVENSPPGTRHLARSPPLSG